MDDAEQLVPILVVDDQANNLLVMENLLAGLQLPLQVVCANSGNRALRLSLLQSFALILLDVQMPEMNGYEVAELLRAHPKTAAIPIIFVTSGMNAEQQVIQGYAAGAVDYLPKPLDERLLGSKVRVFCELFQQRRALEGNALHLEAEVARRSAELQCLNEELEQRVEERSQQLKLALSRVAEAERQDAMGRLVVGVAHELNTPVGNILLAASTLNAELKHFSTVLAGDKVSRQELRAIGEQCRLGASLIETNAHRAAALVDNFKELDTRNGNESPRRFGLKQAIDAVLAALSLELQGAGVQIESDISPNIVAFGFPTALQRILTQLIKNSLLHAFSGQAKPAINLTAKASTDQLTLSYSDNGCGVPSESLSRLLDPFYTTRLGHGGSGMGLSIVRSLAIEQMGGKMALSCPPNTGLRLEFSWPLGRA
ncbi:response regulator [Paucibacter sp. B2R-40]|uniref:hybrid sensor histidine kinase/response regulator n=1 Tax=Paucibacter sp. B2R-40 TaxID=2893554 RepID=UPI0021E37787|nr:response regulator [Paucibacter sp. B2R-40]MCV2356846.1 response regulator [Paucibacter sp. B2R-40]